MRTSIFFKSAFTSDPFGSPMDGRTFSSEKYRFGFNGQERDDEVAGAGNTNTAMFWEYDTRLGRRWNLDPKPNPSISDYACFANNPIMNVDILGDSLGVPRNLFSPLNAGQEGYNENGLNKKDWETYSDQIKNTTGISFNTPTPNDNVLTVSSVNESLGSKKARKIYHRYYRLGEFLIGGRFYQFQ